MAEVTDDWLFGTDPPLRSLNLKTPINGCSRQYRTEMIRAMAITTLSAVRLTVFTLGQILVSLLPETPVVHQLHIVRSFQSIYRQGIGVVARTTLDDRARMALHLYCHQVAIAILVGYGPLSVRDAETALTHHTNMTGARWVRTAAANTAPPTVRSPMRRSPEAHMGWLFRHTGCDDSPANRKTDTLGQLCR